MPPAYDLNAEWLECDGLGGFASGTVAGWRTRRYHALLLAALTPPTRRMVLVNGCEIWLETENEKFWLSSQRYDPDVVFPEGYRHLDSFSYEPWPTWRFMFPNKMEVEQELLATRGTPMTLMRLRCANAGARADLFVRPLLSGRDYHALQRENPGFNFEPEFHDTMALWRPYEDIPDIIVYSNGRYRHEPLWYRNFHYEKERERGLDYIEDLASPGVFQWDLTRAQATMLFTTGTEGRSAISERVSLPLFCDILRTTESQRRQRFASKLHRAADAYIVRRGKKKSIVAGYPWFTDWGRDTFISLRGLCVATGRLEDAYEILTEWSQAVSQGMIPNVFPDELGEPQYNAVDASLWFILAMNDWLWAAEKQGFPVMDEEREMLLKTMERILTGYRNGTRYGIRMDKDGLLACGEPGVQLTWMDAKVGEKVMTPRSGKPVEVQALWLNALWIAEQYSSKWKKQFEKARESFSKRFWNTEGGCLNDVVDVNGKAGTVDAAFRPNQIFAAGGLPYCAISPARSKKVVEAVESRLWTPLGLRTLAPDDDRYHSRYEGGREERDAAYHQGTVWPWLLGPFVEAWIRAHGHTPENLETARQKFLKPLIEHLETAGLGHVSEIADGDPPHTPRGCPFQAWSLAELIRIKENILVE